MLSEAVTAEDIIMACGGSTAPEEETDLGDDDYTDEQDKPDKSNKIEDSGSKTSSPEKSPSIIKRITSVVSLIVILLTAQRLFPIVSRFAWAGLKGELSAMGDVIAGQQWMYSGMLVSFVISATAFCMTVFAKSNVPQSVIQVQRDKRQLSKRTVTAAVLILLLIPLTIYIGVFYLGDRKYYFISLLIILETMLPFVMIFEGRKPQARELVIIASLCGIGVAGRAAFFMLPQFKPVAAMVIISSVAFGGESGFLVGAMTMFLSNMLYGQGPWTPWQMFAMGIIGFLSGVLFRKGLLRRDRVSLAVFGGVSVFLVYGGIMNPASVLMFQSKVSWPMIITSWVTGAPFDLIHAAATVFFLLVMLEKLDRIKVKYGLVE